MGKGGSGFEKKEDAAMPKDAPLYGGALTEQPPPEVSVRPLRKVSEMQAKLHRWAVADSGRRFDDLFNFVCDPATLLAAFGRVAGNQGARHSRHRWPNSRRCRGNCGCPRFLG
jgi:RNA-directed DNA polymerase